ncbi:MAG: Gfo/Idh/MocA family oxidoreductase [Candidatus Hydrogenedentes bacterium]|nr:Gfo/Idh/MocA family oxidoreductase [Candidatus Hydrogenedentota bacterium]
MDTRTVKVTINGTGFAADYTARVYGMIPHKNGVAIELAGVTSGRIENAEQFAKTHHIVDAQGTARAYPDHAAMLAAARPDIDNIACANYTHAPYAIEAAEAGVGVIVLEKPPAIWPGYAEDRAADAETRRHETIARLAEVLDAVRAAGAKLLYAENFVYFDGVRGLVELLAEAMKSGKGKVLYQQGICAHQGSHAPAYDTPSKSGGGALFNKACHPLGPILYLKQVEGILRGGAPIRPAKVSAVAAQVMRHQPAASGEHFRVMQNVDDFGRITVVFEDRTVAEVVGHDMSISGIRNGLSVITDFAEYDVRVNPNDANQCFMPDAAAAGTLLFREKLPTPQGTSFPIPRQIGVHGYVNEMEDAVDCVLDPARFPQSGPLMAWDTMAVLMAGYESSERDAAFVELAGHLASRTFAPNEFPDPAALPPAFQRV